MGSARLIVYTAHFIRAGSVFLIRVPILSVLGLPFQTVRVRVKVGLARLKFGTGKVIYTAKFTPAERCAYHFYPSRAQNFRWCKSA